MTLNPTPTTNKQSFYRPEIDGLRALAVIAVIINHFNHDILPSGYLGVDIFFVISGFVITTSLANHRSETFKDFLLGFYTRRIKRLIPALVLFVLITSTAICLFDPAPDVSLGTGITSLFGLSNLYLLKLSTNYFASATELNVFTHTWSLGVEEQFYFLFPFLVYFTGFTRHSHRGSRNLFYAMGSLSVASLIAFITIFPNNLSSAYFLMPTRLWEMGAGCLLCLALRHANPLLDRLTITPPLAVSAAIVGILFAPFQFALPATIAIVVLTAIQIACLRPGTAGYQLFAHPTVVAVGVISYSLYLWHWGILALSRWTIGIHWWSVPFQGALILLLAVASHRYVETPLRRAQWSKLRWRAIGYGIITSITAALVLLGLDKKLHAHLYSGDYPYQSLMTRSMNNDAGVITRSSQTQQTKTTYTGAKCHLEAKGWGNTPLPVKDCQIKNGDRTFFFVGNSHTDHFRTTHYLLSQQLGTSIDSISVGKCVFPFQSAQKECTDIQIRQANRVLGKIKAGDIVTIANRYIIKDRDGENTATKTWIEEPSAQPDLLEFTKEVSRRGGKVVLFAPTPEYTVSIEQCLPQWYRPKLARTPECSTSRSTFLHQRQAAYAALSKLSPDIYVYDPAKPLCPNQTCAMTDTKSKPLYVDRDHLSDYANSQYIYPDFVAFLRQHRLIN